MEEKYYGWLVLSYDVPPHKNGRKQVLAECTYCGKVKEKLLYSIRNGSSKNCGCIRNKKVREATIRRNTTHGEAKKNTRLYTIWKNIRQRCTNPNATGYANYGAKGISYCKEWNSFETFQRWAQSNGYSDSLTIDRKDSNGNYEPSNCNWVTKGENSAKRNKEHKGLYKSKFTAEEVVRMRRLKNRGYTYSKIADEFECSISNISRLIKGDIKYLKNLSR